MSPEVTRQERISRHVEAILFFKSLNSSSLLDEGIGISLITFGEVYEGIYYGRDPEKTEEVFQRFLRVADILPLTKPITQRFAQIRGELRRTGNIIGDFDILIAATASHHKLTLVTRNLRDYTRIPRLEIYKAS
jgi:tRNA(fMet)-specific endonuclease VapC